VLHITKLHILHVSLSLYVYMLLVCVKLFVCMCLFFNFFNNNKKALCARLLPHCVRKKVLKKEEMRFRLGPCLSLSVLLCKKVIFKPSNILFIISRSNNIFVVSEKTQIKNEKTISFKLI